MIPDSRLPTSTLARQIWETEPQHRIIATVLASTSALHVMTWDTARPATGFGGLSDDDFGLLSGLWEHAPFARLPADAPAEFKDLVEDIENPKRVYAVHRASRRHNFQLLVQKYIVQLRDGCGCSYCTTSTCFTSRRRLAGKAPIRRYNTTSARTLAIYLASQDNPERGLCPGLRQPRGPPAALGSLLFVPNKTQVDTTGPHTVLGLRHLRAGGALLGRERS